MVFDRQIQKTKFYVLNKSPEHLREVRDALYWSNEKRKIQKKKSLLENAYNIHKNEHANEGNFIILMKIDM